MRETGGLAKQLMNERGQPLRWWIVEDALRNRQGHWFEYLQSFQRGLAAEGDQVRFFASKECEAEVARALGAEVVLPKSIWARMGDGVPKWLRLLRIPAHGLATYRAVSKLLSACSASPAAGSTLPPDRTLPDFIFVPTVLIHHLVGWVLLIKWTLRKWPCRVLLFFPNAPIGLNEDGRASLCSDPTAKLFRMCVRLLAKEVDSRKVILGAETRPMVKSLSEVTGVRFTYLPHPVDLSETKPPVTRQPSPATSDNPVVFGCYGSARYEKGSDVLQSAVCLILQRTPGIPAVFCLQWPADFRGADGHLVTLDPFLAGHPKVKIIRCFDLGGYEQQLAQTDVMLLPYRAAYALRVSRLVIEAMGLGLPVAATEGTTLWSQVSEYGSGISCREGSVESLADAIEEIVRNFVSLRRASAAKADAARQVFSVREFRRLLLCQSAA
jgi:glycosyltransferase involved in cell wall biosynthesis